MSAHPDIDYRFDYRVSNTPERITAHEKARAAVKAAALALAEVVAPGREYSLMLTDLESALFWANAGIARPPIPPITGV